MKLYRTMVLYIHEKKYCRLNHRIFEVRSLTLNYPSLNLIQLPYFLNNPSLVSARTGILLGPSENKTCGWTRTWDMNVSTLLINKIYLHLAYLSLFFLLSFDMSASCYMTNLLIFPFQILKIETECYQLFLPTWFLPPLVKLYQWGIQLSGDRGRTLVIMNMTRWTWYLRTKWYAGLMINILQNCIFGSMVRTWHNWSEQV